MIRKRLHLYLITIIMFLLTGLIGCSTQHARSSAMIPDDLSLEKLHPHTVKVIIEGGQEPNHILPTLTNEEFMKAIKMSFANSNIFSEVVNDDNANYLLEIKIIKVTPALSPASKKVTMTSHWKLTKSEKSEALWQDIITSSHTATKAWGGTEREKNAIEGAAKKVIKKGIEKLSMLEI